MDIWHTDLLNDGRKAAVQIAESLIPTDTSNNDSQSTSNEAVRKIIDVIVEIQVCRMYIHTYIHTYIHEIASLLLTYRHLVKLF